MFQFERFLASRYLTGAQGRPEGRRFLRFVTYVSIVGVAVGVAALLLALSIVRGFSREIENKLVGFGAHVQVESMRDAPLDDARRIEGLLNARLDVISVAPVIQDFALLRRSATRIEGISLWGTDHVPEYVARTVSLGTASLEGGDSTGTPVVIGASLARKLGVAPGDRLTAFSPKGSGAGRQAVRAGSFTVAGVFETDLADFDELYAFVPMKQARDLLSLGPDQVTRFDLRLADPSLADTVARSVEAEFGFPLMARTIYEVYRSLFAWVRLQQRIIPLVISVIVIVAAFNIIGTLLMMILEKTGEIGILMSIGSTPATVRRTFLLLGLLIGGAGTVIGEALAWAIATLQQTYGIIRLPADAYFMQTAPVDMEVGDFVLVAIVTLVLCSASAYLPARFAASIRPIEAIRFR